MISADSIIIKLPAGSKKQAFHGLAAAAADLCGGVEDEIFTALLARERLGTTGIGCGVAIPHIKILGVPRMYGILARLEQPVDYDAIDSTPVDIIFALLAPEGTKTTQHLKALAQITRFLRDAENCNKLRTAQNKDDMASVLNCWLERFAA